MKRTRKTEHPIAAAQRLGEQFHAWQTAGLKRAIRHVMPRMNPDLVGHYDVVTAADVRSRPHDSVYMLTPHGRVRARIVQYAGPGANDPRAADYFSVDFDDDRMKGKTMSAEQIAAAVTAANIERAAEQAAMHAHRSERTGHARSNPARPGHVNAVAARLDLSPEWLTGSRLRYAVMRALRGDATAQQCAILETACDARGLDCSRTADIRKLGQVINNPAGWQQAEAGTAVRRAVQTRSTADRQAAASALARLASKRRPSRIPNPADPIASKVTALRRAIRKAVAAHETEGSDFGRHWQPVYRMLDKIEDFAWRNTLAFDGAPLRQEITAATEEGQARRHAYLNAEGERINAARRQEMNTPEARYAAEIQRIYGRGR